MRTKSRLTLINTVLSTHKCARASVCSCMRLCSERGVLLVATIVVAAGMSGCSPGSHVSRVKDAALGQRRIFDIQALAKLSCRPDVQEALITLLQDPDPAIKYYAARALEAHPISDAGRLRRAGRALARLLADRSRGPYCALAPNGLVVCGCTPSLRARAMMTLVEITGEDYGFDQFAWQEYLAAEQ